MRGLARSLLDDPHLAEDVAQQALATALARPPRHLDRPRGWLAAVTRSLAWRALRGRVRVRRRERAASRPEPLPSAADLAARLETQRGVVAAVEALDEPYRSTIVFRYFDGLGPTEIATRQGLPVKTVKTRLSRGLARLRERLGREYGDDRKALAVALAPLVSSPGPRAAAGASTPGEALREGDAVPASIFAGRVVDPEGAGVPGAEVRLLYRSPRNGDGPVNSFEKFLRWDRERHEGPAARGDAEGYFRLDRPYGSESFLLRDRPVLRPRRDLRRRGDGRQLRPRRRPAGPLPRPGRRLGRPHLARVRRRHRRRGVRRHRDGRPDGVTPAPAGPARPDPLC